MRPIAFLLALALLAACGADGEPQPPSQAATQPGLSVTGTAKLGIVVK